MFLPGCARSLVRTVNSPCQQDKQPVHPQVTGMLLCKLAAVLPKESPIDGPSPETEPVQFKAQCDAFEM